MASDGYRRGYVSFAHFLLYYKDGRQFLPCLALSITRQTHIQEKEKSDDDQCLYSSEDQIEDWHDDIGVLWYFKCPCIVK